MLVPRKINRHVYWLLPSCWSRILSASSNMKSVTRVCRQRYSTNCIRQPPNTNRKWSSFLIKALWFLWAVSSTYKALKYDRYSRVPFANTVIKCHLYLFQPTHNIKKFSNNGKSDDLSSSIGIPWVGINMLVSPKR